MHDKRHPLAAVLARDAQTNQAEICQTAQVFGHRRRHLDLALVRRPEAVDFGRARRNLATDVVTRDRQHLAPATRRLDRSFGIVRFGVQRDKPIPVDDGVVIRAEVGIGVEVVFGPHVSAYSSKNLRQSAIDRAGS